MEALSVLKNSYYVINKDFDYYKKKFWNSYYLDVKEEEIKFIDNLFKDVDNILSTQDKMLNYSISAIYTATAVLLEVMERNQIQYTFKDIDKVCNGFSNMEKNQILFDDKSNEQLDEVLFGLLTDGIDLESRKKSGSERTPDEIIKYMLNIIEYDKYVSTSKRIIDPACGTGTFVKQIVERFVDGLKGKDDVNGIKEKLLVQKLICAYDTKPSNVFITKIVIITTLIKRKIIMKITDILEMVEQLPVYCQDFLTVNIHTDYIVGNPPYIRLQNISEKYRNFLKKQFESTTGRFDIYTCFMEKSDKLLNQNGKACLITSNKYLTTNYGRGIRQYLSKTGHVRKLVDLYDTKFFGAAVLPAIIMCENSKKQINSVDYIGVKVSSRKQELCIKEKKLFEYIESKMQGNRKIVQYGNDEQNIFEISRAKVQIPDGCDTWNFSIDDENMVKTKMDEQKFCVLKDIFDVNVGIKTTADKVFVKPMTKSFVEERKFEKKVIYPLIQSFNVKRWKISWGDEKNDRYILYPHREKNGSMVAIDLNEIPNAALYLEECSSTLKNRKYLMEAKNRAWYECWVPQKLSKFKQTKIVTRDIVSSNSFAIDESEKLCQGNTFFLTKKDAVFFNKYMELDEHQYFCFALGILNSKALEYYQKMISGCLYSKKYRYTATNMNQWPIPLISKSNAMKIACDVDELINGRGFTDQLEENINSIVYEAFNLTSHDVKIIEEFIGEKE